MTFLIFEGFLIEHDLAPVVDLPINPPKGVSFRPCIIQGEELYARWDVEAHREGSVVSLLKEMDLVEVSETIEGFDEVCRVFVVT